MQTGPTKTFIIGIFVLITFIAVIWAVLWLKPSVGDEKMILHVRFTNVDKINEGTRVTFAGQPVGTVADIHEVKDARFDTRDGRVYIFEVTLRIDSHLDVYTTDRFTIKTSGLLGERSIEITPVARSGDQVLNRVSPDDILYAYPSGSVEEAFDQIGKLSSSAQGVINKISTALDKLDDTRFWDSLTESVDHFESLANALDQADQIKEAIDNFHSFSTDLKGTGQNLTKTLEKVGNISELVEKITINIGNGEGTVGRFLAKDDFYLDLKSVLHKAELLMDDINHYGILFNNDKKWQRVRAKRANLMAKLCTPQEFQNFFDEEIAQVETSLSRIEGVMNQCDYSTREFECLFSDLLRRVEGLQENLNLYNTELRECIKESHTPWCVSSGIE